MTAKIDVSGLEKALKTLSEVLSEAISGLLDAVLSVFRAFSAVFRRIMVNYEGIFIPAAVDGLVKKYGVGGANEWVQNHASAEMRDEMLEYLGRQYTIQCLDCKIEMYYNENSTEWFCTVCDE